VAESRQPFVGFGGYRLSVDRPDARAMRIAELRAAIQRARDEGDRDRLVQLQAEFRALPLESRRELRTGELIDERAGRRVVRSCSVQPARPAIARAMRADSVADGQGTLFGHYAVFDVWTEVESFWEGNFMEAIGKGSFAKTIANDRQRVTLNHGRDTYLANKILGRIDVHKEDATGAYYEVALYRGIPELVLEGLRDGAYGASFRFYVMAETFVEKPSPSSYNPRGIPERTITEAMVEEFGPVTFPQYPEATAQLRSRQIQRSTPTAAGTHGRETRKEDRDTWIRSLA
jgi:phage head maturation protease